MTPSAEDRRFGRAMAAGSAWMIGGRWVLRLIGLVSTVILARLLAPEDFGLVAMAMLAVGALQVLAETGQRQAIVRMEAPTRAHYDTAWTIGLLSGVTIALALALAAPLVARAFDEPRLAPVMWLLALRPLIQGLENIGLVDFQRAMDFRRDLAVMLAAKVAGFAVTIALAIAVRSYWALIAGTLAGGAVALVASYIASPFRPRPSLARWRELAGYSLWSAVTSLALYAGERADHVVVAQRLDAAALGAYTVAQELATLPTEELVVPPVRALFAVYARVAGDRVALARHYLNALGFIALVACATGVGVALVAGDLVRVVLGERWASTIPLIGWFAMAAGIMGVARSVNTVLLAAGYARANAVRALGFAATLTIAALAGVRWRGAEGAAIARFAVTLAFAPVMLLFAMRLLSIEALAVAKVLWRPSTAAALMAGSVLLLHPHLPPAPALRLTIEAAAGAAIYGTGLCMLWLAAGRPSGPEATLVEALRSRLRRSGPIAE